MSAAGILHKSLSWKLFAAFITVIIVVLSVFTVFSVLREGDKAKQALREQGAMLTELLARDAMLGVFAENAGMLKEPAAQVAGLSSVAAVSIYDAGFRELYAVQKAPGTRTEAPLTVPALKGIMPAALETRDSLVFTGPVTLEPATEADESLYFNTTERSGQREVIGYVRVELSKAGYRKEILSVVRQNVFVALAFLLASVIIVHFAIRKVTRPLGELTEKVRSVGLGLPVEPVPVETGDEVGNLAASFNVMVRARAEAENSLRESEERYRRLVELSPDAIYVQQQGEIVFINASGVKLLGAASAEDLLGKPALERVHESSRPVVERRMLQAEQEGRMVPPVPVQYLRPDGAAVDEEITAAPFTFLGKSAALVIARDETERKGMEEKIRQYQKELFSVALEMSSLESRVEERERHLIATDLHDYVGQNLAVLNFMVGRLQQQAAPDSPGIGPIRELLEQTIQYTRSLTIELNPPILVELGFKPALDSLAEAFEKTHGLCILVEDDGRSKEVHGETRYLLFRCVRELLVNVVKHSRAREVRISVTAADRAIRLEIEDDGVGFELERAAGKGGFGLFSIRERLRRLNGSCSVESRSGRGTRVVLTAPLKEWEQEQAGRESGGA